MKSFEIVKMLIEADANVQHTCRDGRTVLDYAINMYGDECLEIIALLLKTGKFNEKDREGRYMSLLHKLCLTSRSVKVEKTAAYLIEKGFVNIDAVEGKGKYVVFFSVFRITNLVSESL